VHLHAINDDFEALSEREFSSLFLSFHACAHNTTTSSISLFLSLSGNGNDNDEINRVPSLMNNSCELALFVLRSLARCENSSILTPAAASSGNVRMEVTLRF
jgi:hypothetical protein